jgi:DNA-binding SARP family transcriptional activator
MTPALELRVLGPLEVSQGWSALRHQLPAAASAAHRADDRCRCHLVDRAADRSALGRDPPPAARNSLQSHVARLRALIGEDAILTRPPGYALDCGRCGDRCGRLRTVRRGCTRPDGQRPGAAASTLRDALATWRGAAHAEFADDLALGEALRLENLRIDARGLLAEAYLRRRPAAAVDTVLRLQGDVPLREDVTIAAARALHAVGRTTEALELLRTYRSRLSDELGLDPGRGVDHLEQQLLRGETIELEVRPRMPAPRLVEPPLDSASTAPRPTPTPPPYAGTDTLGREDGAGTIERRCRRSVGHARRTRRGRQDPAGHRRGAGAIRPRGARRMGRPRHRDEPRRRRPADHRVPRAGLTGPCRPATAASALARFRGLVVLDNCEHVLDAVAGDGRARLALDSQVRMLATSRERLDVAGEQVILVHAAADPGSGAASEQDAAVQLFQERLAATGAVPSRLPRRRRSRPPSAGCPSASSSPRPGRRRCPSTNCSTGSATIWTSSSARRVVTGSATGRCPT